VTPQLNEPGSDEGSVKAVISNVFSLLFLVCFQFIVILRAASREKNWFNFYSGYFNAAKKNRITWLRFVLTNLFIKYKYSILVVIGEQCR
jgi:hypothetical protein